MVDTKLGGYEIPKDTAVLASLFALHTATDVWKDPDQFRPERYLNMKGELTLKYDKSLPFGGN
jgi:cytochrome P450